MTAIRIARVSGWLLLFAAAFLTLAPRTFRPQSGIEHHLEHFLAFALLGLTFGLGYPGRRLALALAGAVVVALLETFQAWAPGRHANFSDFAINAIGLCVGLASAIVVDWLRRAVASLTQQRAPLATPLPDPPPQAGREQTELAAPTARR